MDGPPEFFANGLLVHNCDAVRYLLMSRPRLHKVKHLKPDTREQRVKDDLENLLKARTKGALDPVMGKTYL